ncbi:MAG: YciI family protein [Acidimicrobiia bacterium]
MYVFTSGPRPELATDPKAWTESDEAIAEDHFSYLRRATEEGVVILAGRSQDGIGPAIVILEANSQAEALRFMEQDPFITSGLFGADLHEFRVALQRSREDLP